MSALTIYRLKMVLGIALLLTAGALQIFWKSPYSYAVEAALALIGIVLAFSKAGSSEDILKAQKKFSPSTVRVLNFAILATMAIFLVVGIAYVVMH